MKYFICLILLIVLLMGCQARPEDINTVAHSVHMDTFIEKKLESEIEQNRQQRDQFFRTSPDSPLPPEVKLAFTGLEYYPVNWRYRFEGPVNRYDNPQPFKMITTTGEWRQAVKFGYVLFNLEGRDFKLQVYRLLEADQKNLLFIPFIDSNVGKETYPAGRYIDLVEKENGIYVIDFNNAYNPSCAYGSSYDCPVTPKENKLSIAIPAGEKILPIAAKIERANEQAGGKKSPA